MAATINGTTFDDTPVFTAGSKWVEGQPVPGIVVNQIEDISAPGADWTIQKNYGRRQQIWSVNLAFCESSFNSVVDTVQTFIEGLTPGRFSCTFASVDLGGCRGESAAPGIPFAVNQTGTTVAVFVVAVTISRNAA